MANRFEIAVHEITGKRLPKVKRTWHYIQNPSVYGIECPKNKKHNIEWSEWDGCLWCHSCKKDIKITKKNSGIFLGPIGIKASALLGICFDRWDMVKKEFIVRDDARGIDLYLSLDEYKKLKEMAG